MKKKYPARREYVFLYVFVPITIGIIASILYELLR